MINVIASVSRVNFNIDLSWWLSTRAILPPELPDILEYLGTFLVVTAGQERQDGCATGIYWVEARNSTKHLTQLNPHNKALLDPKCP